MPRLLGGVLSLVAMASPLTGQAPRPVGSEFLVASSSDAVYESVQSVQVLPREDGSFLAVWKERGNGTWVRRFDASGRRVGGRHRIGDDAVVLNPRPNGTFLGIWSSARRVFARNFDPQGQPVGEAFQVAQATDIRGAAVARRADGSWGLVWQRCSGSRALGFFAKTLTPNGRPAGPGELLTVSPEDCGSFDVASNGEALVVASGDPHSVRVTWWKSGLASPSRVVSPDYGTKALIRPPSVAGLAGGGFVVGWLVEDFDRSTFTAHVRPLDDLGKPTAPAHGLGLDFVQELALGSRPGGYLAVASRHGELFMALLNPVGQEGAWRRVDTLEGREMHALVVHVNAQSSGAVAWIARKIAGSEADGAHARILKP